MLHPNQYLLIVAGFYGSDYQPSLVSINGTRNFVSNRRGLRLCCCASQ
jgi:hypothetical protein